MEEKTKPRFIAFESGLGHRWVEDRVTGKRLYPKSDYEWFMMVNSGKPSETKDE